MYPVLSHDYVNSDKIEIEVSQKQSYELRTSLLIKPSLFAKLNEICILELLLAIKLKSFLTTVLYQFLRHWVSYIRSEPIWSYCIQFVHLFSMG